MINEKIKEFYIQIAQDKDFKEKILKAKEKYIGIKDPKERFYKIANELILPLAKHHDFNFTVDELLEYEKQAISQNGSELGEDELEAINGGFSSAFASISLSALMGVGSIAGISAMSAPAVATSTENSNDSSENTPSSYSYNIDEKAEQASAKDDSSQLQSTATPNEITENVENKQLNMKSWLTGIANALEQTNDETAEEKTTKEHQGQNSEEEDLGLATLFDEKEDETPNTPPPLPPRPKATASSSQTEENKEEEDLGLSTLSEEKEEEATKAAQPPEENKDESTIAQTSEEGDLGLANLFEEKENSEAPPLTARDNLSSAKETTKVQQQTQTPSAQIQEGTKLKPVKVEAKTQEKAQATQPATLASQIQQAGTTLKHVDQGKLQEKKNKQTNESKQIGGVNADTLYKAIKEASEKFASNEKSTTEKTTEDSVWDD